jgi:hypothetical protein
MIAVVRIWIAALALMVLAPAWAQEPGEQPVPPSLIVRVPMSDGVKIAAAVYLPKAPGRYPALFAASPYRFDNDGAPAVPVFLWRETGPIAWYLDHGYAYVHMDARGSGRSGGQYRYQDKREQRDLYEMIEWIAKQPWSNGKVGGIGQSYYARMQWFMGIENPPHLACIAPYDGNVDTYRASAYQGGIPSGYIPIWYEGTRDNNNYPLAGAPRLMPWDYVGAVRAHPTYDAWWKERAAAETLDKIKVPVFSIGVWSKVDLHLNGNIVGFERAGGPKKLLVFGSSNVYAAVADYSGVPFHEKYLLEFYDWCLKGKATNYASEPAVRYFVTGADAFQTADTWPPPNLDYRTYYLGAGPTGSVTSLNDGALGTAAPPADGVALRRRRARPRPPSRPGPPHPDLREPAARGRPASDRADRGRALCLLDAHRHRLHRQPRRAIPARRRRPAEGPQPQFPQRHQGLAARLAPGDRPGALAAARALVHAYRSAEARAGADLQARRRNHADGLSLQEREPHPHRRGAERFAGHRLRLRPQHHPGHGRHRHDLLRRGASLAGDAADPAGRCAKGGEPELKRCVLRLRSG